MSAIEKEAYVSTPASPANRGVVRAMDVPRKRPHRRRALWWGAAVVVALAAATVGISRLGAAPPVVERGSVWIDTVRRGEMVRQVQGNGTLVPELIRWITSVTTGRVERILVQPGTRVSADTVLLELTNPDVSLQALEADRQVDSVSAELANLEATQRRDRLAQESQVASIRSQLNQAKRQASADAALAARGFLSELEMAQSKGRAEELESRLEFEQKRLTALSEGMKAQLSAERTRLQGMRSVAEFRHRDLDALHVRAGIDGVLQEQPLQVGQSVATGTLLAKVAQPERLKAELNIPEVQAKDVQVGQPVAIDTHNGVIQSRVSRINPSVQAGSVKVEVKLEGTLPPGARPDLSVQGSIELEKLENVLYVGRPAITGQSGGKIALFRVDPDDAGAVRGPVVLGRASVRTVEIKSGLKEGDKVILSDMSRYDAAERIRLQ